MRAHIQGLIDTKEERLIQANLIKEHMLNSDILAAPMRDTYQNLPNKLFYILMHAYYAEKAGYLVIHDDDFCLDARALQATISMHQPTKELFAGTYK